MPKEKYEPPDPRRMYTIMSSEEAANGKKSHWAELEISGKTCTHKFNGVEIKIVEIKLSNASALKRQCCILPVLIILEVGRFSGKNMVLVKVQNPFIAYFSVSVLL